jgi:hypothetical protein
MQLIGYSLVALATGEEVLTPLTLPVRLDVPGVGVSDFDAAGQVIPDSAAPTHMLVERWADTAPSPEHTIATESVSFDGTKVLVTRTWNAPPAPTPAQLYDYLKNKRTAVEEGGCPFAGTVIATDPESQSKVSAAYFRAMNDVNFQIAAWKIAPGQFVSLDNATLRAMGDAVGNHVQACFNKEAELSAQIAAGTVTTYTQIDTAEWPANVAP